MLYEGVTSLLEPYHMSVAIQDLEKSMNYCRIFTEMAETFLEAMIATPNQGFGDLRTLELLLTCIGHHHFEIVDITFNFWNRLSKVLYHKNKPEIVAVFQPYVQRLVIVLCRLCQYDSTQDGLPDEADDFDDFRVRSGDLVKDVEFIVEAANIVDLGTEYHGDIEQRLNQNNNNDDERREAEREVARTDRLMIPYKVLLPPKSWASYKVGNKSQRVEVKVGTTACGEFHAIMSPFDLSDISIQKVEHVQHFELHQHFQLQKLQMGKINGPIMNERIGFHGCSAVAMQSIADFGFNRSFAGQSNGSTHGKGICFSTIPENSMRVKYAPKDKRGLQYCFVSRILCGRYVKGEEDAIEPPVMPDNSGRYDSLVDDVVSPSIFVIFKDSQMYPNYLITFKSVARKERKE